MAVGAGRGVRWECEGKMQLDNPERPVKHLHGFSLVAVLTRGGMR